MTETADNDFLLMPFSETENKEALFSMHPESGQDGMNMTFFQRFWHVVGQEVCSTYLSIISSRTIPNGLNNTHI